MQNGNIYSVAQCQSLSTNRKYDTQKAIDSTLSIHGLLIPCIEKYLELDVPSHTAGIYDCIVRQTHLNNCF